MDSKESVPFSQLRGSNGVFASILFLFERPFFLTLHGLFGLKALRLLKSGIWKESSALQLFWPHSEETLKPLIVNTLATP